MVVGPVDVAIIGFPGNKFSGKIAPALMDLVASGTIRVLDLIFVSKDGDGVISFLTVGDLGAGLAPSFVNLTLARPGALNGEDADEIADDLPPNSSAALIAWENLWASHFVAALREADAVLIDQIRIPSDVAATVLEG